jgi:hypothetical protein
MMAECSKRCTGLSLLMAAMMWCGICVSPAAAQDTGFPVLRLGTFADHLSMGDTYTAYVRGPASMHGNPAGLARAGANSASVSYQSWVSDTNIYGASARFGVGGRSGVGVSLAMFDSGTLDARDQPGPGDPFSVQYVSLSAGYGITIGPLRMGVAGKFLSERIYSENATGMAVDAGAQATFFDEHLLFGISVHNLGSMEELGIEATPLPAIVRIGAAGYPVRLYSEGDGEPTLRAFVSPEVVIFPDGGDARLHIGGGVEMPDLLAVRVGYISGDAIRSVTFGAGITYTGLVFDYGFLPLRDGFGGPSHVLTLRYEW